MAALRRIASSPKIRERILYIVVILVGLIATYAASTAIHNSAHNRDLVKQVAAEQKSLAAAQIQLSEQTHALCVAIKKGRVIFKNILDQNGLVIASRISLVRCPAQVKKPKPHS